MLHSATSSPSSAQVHNDLAGLGKQPLKVGKFLRPFDHHLSPGVRHGVRLVCACVGVCTGACVRVMCARRGLPIRMEFWDVVSNYVD